MIRGCSHEPAKDDYHLHRVEVATSKPVREQVDDFRKLQGIEQVSEEKARKAEERVGPSLIKKIDKDRSLRARVNAT